MDDVRFTSRPAPPALAHAVLELWHLDDPGAPHCGLPKPFVEIVISLRGIHWWWPAPGMPEHRYATSWVTPVQNGPRFARAEGRRQLVGARLHPWAAKAWLGALPPGDGTPPPRLSQWLGREAGVLRDSLKAAAHTDAMFARLADWLAARLPGPDAINLLHPADETGRARDLAMASQATPRHYRRVFAGGTGLAPKRWLLLRRLDAVLRDPRLADPHFSLAILACEHGFADQAHLTRDMKRFTGATPGQFRHRATHYPPHMLLPR
ncbi:helix-turn-helix transcriptional regulator [Sphingomonas sp. 35-24ZXX]|uniref:helix-turn-helix transcriptional regulator n=1 Tax=Sphingomonas sp. 35-24ZXX TaxID=1545915 RepID=UPI000690AC27|nr:AraC family transcriptional regulator [Sphingomonas sp. 35-24ZXX]